MAEIVVSEFISVDGVIEDPGGAEGTDRGGWAFKFERGAEGDRFKLDEVMQAGALLLGRNTYENFAAAWPDRTDDVGFADKMNSMPKYVVSRTLTNPTWNNTTVLGGDLGDEIDRLKQAGGGYLLLNGSGQLARALGGLGLVDEYRLMVYPTILGKGKRLFAEGADEAQALKLVDAKPAGETVILTYRRA
jgi:dihydrofolate reductase